MFNYSACTNICVHVYVDTSQRMMNVIHICVDYGEVGLGIERGEESGGGGLPRAMFPPNDRGGHIPTCPPLTCISLRLNLHRSIKNSSR